mmetsp:Transcript_6189/g.15453  ORF Transcript_6189/g.15453 Transcript_6189/m.15453 type:complete len:611 (-) Transcript_6189:267-2099(-)
MPRSAARQSPIAHFFVLLLGATPRTFAKPLPASFPAETTSITLDNNQYTGTIPTQYGLLLDLTSLSATVNLLNGTLPSELGQLVKTSSAAFGWNSISGSMPSELGNLVEMDTTLSVNNNLLRGVLPTELGKLGNMMRDFNFETNRFSSAIPTQLGSLDKMEADFFLSGNGFTGALPTELGNLVEMTSSVGLDTMLLSGPMPTELGRLSQLQENFWAYNLGDYFRGTIPTELGNMGALQNNFWLSSTANRDHGFTSTIPTELGKLEQMTFNFNIKSNLLTSSLPTELGKMSTMYLSDDNEATYSADWYFMFKLEQNTGLCGTVPTELGAISQESWSEETRSRFLMINGTSIGEDCSPWHRSNASESSTSGVKYGIVALGVAAAIATLVGVYYLRVYCRSSKSRGSASNYDEVLLEDNFASGSVDGELVEEGRMRAGDTLGDTLRSGTLATATTPDSSQRRELERRLEVELAGGVDLDPDLLDRIDPVASGDEWERRVGVRRTGFKSSSVAFNQGFQSASDESDINEARKGQVIAPLTIDVAVEEEPSREPGGAKVSKKADWEKKRPDAETGYTNRVDQPKFAPFDEDQWSKGMELFEAEQRGRRMAREAQN